MFNAVFSVTLAEGALIRCEEADVRGADVRVAGAVAGNLSADSTLVLEAGARVVGDLAAPQIGIRPGALLRGRVDTGDASSAPSRPARASRAASANAATRP